MQEYLHKYIEALKLINAELICALQDADFKHIWCSDKYLELLGFDSFDNLDGLRFTDIDSPCWKEFMQSIQPASKRIVKEKNNSQFCASYVHWITKEPGIALVDHKKIRDPYTQELICVIVELQPLNLFLLNQIKYTVDVVLSTNKLKVESSPLRKEIDITADEREILILLIIGKPYKVIVDILQQIHQTPITENMVKNIIHKKLLKKFGVFNVSQLIQQVTKLNLINEIPSSLLQLINESNAGLLNFQIKE